MVIDMPVELPEGSDDGLPPSRPEKLRSERSDANSDRSHMMAKPKKVWSKTLKDGGNLLEWSKSSHITEIEDQRRRDSNRSGSTWVRLKFKCDDHDSRGRRKRTNTSGTDMLRPENL
jgi:hypothetical protein